MLRLLSVALFAICAHSLLHHLAVGTVDGQALYSLELDDQARLVYMIQARDAAGSSPSLTLDRSKTYMFSSRPVDGTLTRYTIATTYELVSDGTMEIPTSCNTTKFTSLHLTSSTQNLGIWGTASTGTCSVIFGLTTDGYTILRSKEILGDIHSLAWSPDGRNLHALDSHSTALSTTSITNFRIAADPTLEDVVGTDVLANVTSASQIVSHPTGDQIYLVTKDTNELISVPMKEGSRADRSMTAARYKVLPPTLDPSQFHTSSLAITASKATLWTLSQSHDQAVISAFNLNATTGAIIDVAARATWKGTGEGQLIAATFETGDIVAITNSPSGYITILGLDQPLLPIVHNAEVGTAHEYLQPLSVYKQRRDDLDITVAKIKSYGRTLLDEYIGLGESVWID